MFAKQGDGGRIAWSVVNVRTRIVRDSGHAGTLADCIVQAGDGEDVLIGQALPEGTQIMPDGTVVEAPVPAVEMTVADVKAEAARRLRYTDWAIVRAAEDPTKPVPPEILADRASIRARSGEIEKMKPIPPDLKNPALWA